VSGLARVLVAAAAVAMLAGCGFRLRGEVPLPPGLERPWIEAPPDSRLAEPLRRALARAGAVPASAPGEASAVLVLGGEEMTTEVLSIGGGARIREFRIRYRLRLEARDPAGGILLAPARLELSRDYNFDERGALGAELEAEQLREELTRDMLQAALRHIAAAARARPP
jgi:LPS-assembly lipoprotein